VVKRKAPRLSRRGTRSSARLRGQNPTDIHEPTPIEPETKQMKRKREPLDEDDADELSKRARRSDNQTSVPARANSATTSDSPPVDLISSENVTVDHREQSVNVVVEGSTVASPSKDEPSKPRRFFPQLEDLQIIFGLGGSGS
jgi:hypothetical protein